MQCFENSGAFASLDRDAFKFRHKLLGHPALSLENLAQVLPALPKERVMYSMRKLQNGDDFESTFAKRPAEQGIEATIEQIRTSDSYIMVSGPEVHPSFAPLHRELMADVESVMRAQGVGDHAVDPQLYLFIASPGSVTPFHIDRYSTFLMQFRGSKTVTVFPQWDERVVSLPHTEAYMAYANTRLPWSDERNAFGKPYEFSPGEALHIPFAAGHHVRNGTGDVSISMSIIFNTDESVRWRHALAFNHRARKLLGRVGMQPAPVAVHAWRDSIKSSAFSLASRLKRGAVA
ncbi:cupin-like domain-containing protein [Xenophilus aerolatus]|nr:cupin-like domain-containing protein [Xenophilus aerolatus]